MERFRLWWHASPIYWKVRDYKARTVFWIKRRAFGVLYALNSTKEKGAIGLSLVRASKVSVLWALAIVFMTQGVAVCAQRTGFLSILFGPANRDIYHGLVLTVAGVGGALLGLYFTAMTVVLSEAYIDATSDVRRLLVFDRAGTTYTSWVTIMVVASLAVVGMDLVGIRPTVLTILSVTLIAVLASASLLAVGARAFGLFDPVALGPTIRLDFNRWVHQASSKGLGRRDISFQTLYQRKANAALSTLSSLADVLIRRSDHESDSLVQMGYHLHRAWLDYASAKSSISMDSRWFRRRYQHREWRNDAFGVDMALQTGTYLAPIEVGEMNWVESELADPLGRVCVALARKREEETTGQLLTSINRLLEVLGQRLQVDEARLLWSSMQNSILPEIKKASASQEQSSWATLATDLLALAPISIVVGVAKGIKSYDKEYVADRVDAMLQGRRRFWRGPAALDKKLDWLRIGIDFERAIEGRRVTPRWWLIEEASRSMVEFCSGMLPGIVDDYETYASANAEALIHSPKLQAIASFRELELLDKLSVHAATVGVTCTSLSAVRHLTSNPWPDNNVDSVQKRVSALHSMALRTIARISPDLGIQSGTVGDEPDFFGRANALLVDDVFQAVLRDDPEQIRAVFPSAFQSALQVYAKRRSNLDANAEPHLFQRQINSVVDPIMDLLELSGYALLADELGRPQAWQEFERVWSVYLGDNADFVAIVFTLLRLQESSLGFIRSDISRTKREMKFWQTMLGDDLNKIRNRYGMTRRPHKSILVELTAFSSGLYDPGVAFVCLYLRPMYSGDGDLPEKVRGFQEALDREQRRRQRP